MIYRSNGNLKKIKGFDGYFCTERGEVFSNRTGRLRKLKGFEHSAGYINVKIRKDGKRFNTGVHRLVLLTFRGPCPRGKECSHLDGNAKNNHISNLAWCTKKENASHKKLHKTQAMGEQHHLSKVKEKDVLNMRSEFIRKSKKNSNAKVLSKKYGLTVTTIWQIINRDTWKHI